MNQSLKFVFELICQLGLAICVIGLTKSLDTYYGTTWNFLDFCAGSIAMVLFQVLQECDK